MTTTPHCSRTSTRRDGFGLIVIAALFTAVAVIGTAMLEKKTVTNELTNQQAQRGQLARISSALNQYALRFGRLPCPAQTSIPSVGMDSYYGAEVNSMGGSKPGKCTKADFMSASNGVDSYAGIEVLTNNGAESEMIRGMVPFKQLGPFGLSEDDVYDAQNNRIMYVVNRNLTSDKTTTNMATDHVLLTDAASGGAVMEMDFVLVSYGRDKLGGIPRGAQPTGCVTSGQTAAEQAASKSTTCQIAAPARCPGDGYTGQNCNSDVAFTKNIRNVTGDANNYFDDDVLGGRVTCSNGSLNRSSDGGCSNTYCWGDNSSGQLGNGAMSSSTIPVAVTMPNGVKSFQSVSVSATASFNAACAIAASFDSAGKPLPYGDIYCWGNWDDTISRTVPTKITFTTPSNFKATRVQVENSSICATGGTVDTSNNFTADGNIYCWGKNGQGQLGNNSTADEAAPVKVNQPAAGVTFTGNFSGDGSRWCAVGSDTKVYCWGDGYGNIPIQLSAAGTDVFSIGNHGSTAYKIDGSLVGWSAAWPTKAIYTTRDGSTAWKIDIKEAYEIDDGQGNPITQYQHNPNAKLNGPESSRDGNDNHQCMILNANGENSIYCKGDNGKGQLGIGNNGTSPSPDNFVEVAAPTGVQFKSISISAETTCAVGNDGKAYCWGNNDNGQLGIGSNSANKPTAVSMPAAVNSLTAIAAGGNTSCALAPIN